MNYRKYYRYRRYRRYRRNRENPIEKLVAFIGTLLIFGLVSTYYNDKEKFLQIVFVLIIPGIIISTFIFLKRRGVRFRNDQPISEEQARLPYQKNKALLTDTEKNFYRILEKIAEENNLVVQSKVRLEDIVSVPLGVKNRWGLRNRIKSRHIDFVLCDREGMSPRLAIELDDSSHEREDRIERDQNIDLILHDAGLPILHIKSQSSYNIEALAARIQDYLVRE